jgi:predicted phosphodiesterase
MMYANDDGLNPPLMTSRTLILSDLHLGRPHQSALSAEALRPLWQGCQRLIINGDVAEVHHPTHWAIAARHVLRLFDLCEADNVELTLLSGNHDPFITDLRHLHLADGSIFVTHGDVLHPAVAPWSPRAAQMRRRHDQALATFPPEARDSLQARLTASQHASQADLDYLQIQVKRSPLSSMLHRPWAVLQVLWYWRRFPRIAAKFVAEHAPLARFAVLGHTHLPGIWNVGGRIIINTGSYGFPGKPWAVMVEDDQGRALSVLRIEGRGAEYGFAREPRARYELPVEMKPEAAQAGC